MTPERWREIERLYHAALEREPGERARVSDRTPAAAMTRCAARWNPCSTISHGPKDFMEQPAVDRPTRQRGPPVRAGSRAGPVRGTHLRLLRSAGAHRRRRHGRGVSRCRYAPEPHRRHQDTAGTSVGRSGPPGALQARSAHRLQPEPSAHLHALRRRRAGRHPLPGHGAHRGRDAPAAAGAGPAAAGPRARIRDPDLPMPSTRRTGEASFTGT